MYSGKAVVYVISYDREETYGSGSMPRQTLERHYKYDQTVPMAFQTRMDSKRQREQYPQSLLDGPNTKHNAKAYSAKVGDANETVARVLTFSRESQNRQITVKQAGVVAICFCAMGTTILECEDTTFWIFAAA